VSNANRPHVLGVDDAPFEKGQAEPVPIVGVMMEGADLVENVAVTAFPVDGDGATEFLGDWIGTLRSFPSLQGVILGGITLAGLGLVDVPRLTSRLNVPVLTVTRRDPATSQLADALTAAKLEGRLPILERAPAAFQLLDGLYVSYSGIDEKGASRLVKATLRKSNFPEPLGVAHLVASALVLGESRGRV
jgi:endonuclease V-like protein UPF0215 family